MSERPGPSVVALGGGHGLAAVLRAVRRYGGEITAVVSVADDGGSSGRLRRELGIPPPGDLRKCLAALAPEGSVWDDALEFRFRDGTLAGHALGNLVIAAVAEMVGDFGGAVDEVGRLVGAVGQVLPATVEPVVLKALVDGRPVEGQVAVAYSAGRVEGVEIVPADARPSPAAVEALARADQVVLAPGSLFTSLVPVLCVKELAAAVASSPGRVVQVANLEQQVPETEGLSAEDHLVTVLERTRVDAFLYDPRASLALDAGAAEAVAGRGVEPVAAEVADGDVRRHDPDRLGRALAALAGSLDNS